MEGVGSFGVASNAWKTVVNNDSPIAHGQESDGPRSRPASRHRNGIALGLVLTPALFILGAVALVWITPLRFANRSFACELRATYLQPTGMAPPLSNVGPPSGLSVTNMCPHRRRVLFREGPILYSLEYAHVESIAVSVRTAVSMNTTTRIAFTPITARLEALAGSALDTSGIPFLIDDGEEYAIRVLDCDRELALKILNKDARDNQYEIRF
jgi:hypothetical protein